VRRLLPNSRVAAWLAALWLAAVPAGAATPVGGLPLFSGGEADFTLVHGSDKVELERASGRWWVTASDGVRRLADRAGVEALMQRLEALRTVRPVADFGRPAKGAFDTPLVIAQGGRQVQIGAASRIPGLVYARLGDGSLHLMRPVDLDPAALRLVDRRLFPDGLGLVAEIDVNGPGLVMHASHAFGPWRLTAPFPSAADGPRIDAWLSRVASLKGDPSSKPMDPGTGYQTVLTGPGGVTQKLVLTRDGRAVLDGTPLDLDGPPGGLVPEHFDWLRKEVIRVPPAGITGIQVQQAESTVVLARHGDEPWAEKDTGKVYKSWVNDLFTYIQPLPAIGLLDGTPDTLGPAQVEVRFWRDAQVAATIELWMDGDGRWWARGGDAVNVFEIPEDLPRHLAKMF
jgi:hypothetical protein